MNDHKARVVAVTDGSLLTSGLVRVLQESGVADLVAVGEQEGHVYQRIRDAGPEVVIIGAKGAHESGPSVWKLLEDNPRSTVIALSLGRPEIEVFRARRINRPTVEDLLHLLKGARKRGERPRVAASAGRTRANQGRRNDDRGGKRDENS